MVDCLVGAGGMVGLVWCEAGDALTDFLREDAADGVFACAADVAVGFAAPAGVGLTAWPPNVPEFRTYIMKSYWMGMVDACVGEITHTFFTIGVAGALEATLPVGLTEIDVLALAFEGEEGTAACFVGLGGEA